MVEPQAVEVNPRKGIDMTDNTYDHDEVIEIFVEYKMGFYSKRNAINLLGKYGFEPNVAEAMLGPMKKHNVVDIRGYVKTPERLKKGHDKWLAEKRGCTKDTGGVETDNKS